MSKKNFVSLILGTVGGILFALGMCMWYDIRRADIIPRAYRLSEAMRTNFMACRRRRHMPIIP